MLTLKWDGFRLSLLLDKLALPIKCILPDEVTAAWNPKLYYVQSCNVKLDIDIFRIRFTHYFPVNIRNDMGF
jgi:hypothetical protein